MLCSLQIVCFHYVRLFFIIQIYKRLTEVSPNDNSEFAMYMIESQRIYEEAVRSLPNPEPPQEYKGIF